MAQCNKAIGLIGGLCLLSLPMAHAATTAVVNFNGSIYIGTCNIALDSHLINFGVHRTSAFATNPTVDIQPLIAQVDCTTAAPAPRITVTGSLPFAGASVFRDNSPSTAAGVGFMVRDDYAGASLSNFYNNAIALTPTNSLTLPAIPAGTTLNHKFLLGLVKSSTVPATAVTGGSVEVTLTFNVDFI